MCRHLGRRLAERPVHRIVGGGSFTANVQSDRHIGRIGSRFPPTSPSPVSSERHVVEEVPRELYMRPGWLLREAPDRSSNVMLPLVMAGAAADLVPDGSCDSLPYFALFEGLV
jgi:hypothetical protein